MNLAEINALLKQLADGTGTAAHLSDIERKNLFNFYKKMRSELIEKIKKQVIK